MNKKRITTLETPQCSTPCSQSTWMGILESFMYYKRVQGLSDRTLQDHDSHVNYFFKLHPTAWGDDSIVNELRLKNELFEYLSRNVKPATFNLRLTYLKCFLQYALDEGYIKSNPLIQFKKRKAEARVVELPEDILTKLLALPDKKNYSGLRDFTLILFILDTGTRPSEALSLLPSDIALKYGVATIPAEIAKTRTSRTLPLLPPNISAIEKLIKVRPSEWRNDVPLFCSFEGTRMTKDSLRGRLDKYSEMLGVKIRPYDLRYPNLYKIQTFLNKYLILLDWD
jgi:integrase/recombinase XerC